MVAANRLEGQREARHARGSPKKAKSHWLRSTGPRISDANVLRSPPERRQAECQQCGSGEDQLGGRSFIHPHRNSAGSYKGRWSCPGKHYRERKAENQGQVFEKYCNFRQGYFLHSSGRQKAHKTLSDHVGKFTVYPKEAWGPILLGSGEYQFFG